MTVPHHCAAVPTDTPVKCPCCGGPVTLFRDTFAPGYAREVPYALCETGDCSWVVPAVGHQLYEPIERAREAARILADAGEWGAFDIAMSSYTRLCIEAAVTSIDETGQSRRAASADNPINRVSP